MLQKYSVLTRLAC